MQNEKQKLVQILLNPDHFSDEDNRFITEMTEKYPYSSALHLLQARSYQLEKGTTESEFTNLAAIYSPDRTLLFDLLNRPYHELAKNHEGGEKNPEEENHQEEAHEPVPQTKLKAENPFSEHDHLLDEEEFHTGGKESHLQNSHYLSNPDFITPDMDVIDPIPAYVEEFSEEPLNLQKDTIKEEFTENPGLESEHKGSNAIFPDINHPPLTLKEESLLSDTTSHPSETDSAEFPVHPSFQPEAAIHTDFVQNSRDEFRVEPGDETHLPDPEPKTEESNPTPIRGEMQEEKVHTEEEKESSEDNKEEEMHSLKKEWEEEIAFEKVTADSDALLSETPISESLLPSSASSELVKSDRKTNEETRPNLHVRQTFLFWLKKTQKGYFLNPGRNSGGLRLDLNQPIRHVGGLETLERDYQTNIFHLGTLTTGNPNQTIEFDLSKKEDQLIEQFLRTDPQHISPFKAEKSDYSVENQVEKASRDSSELVSETLANLYLQQKLYEKAIMAYEKLSLKMPEKNAYFAEIIQKIRSQPF